jgi:cyclase
LDNIISQNKSARLIARLDVKGPNLIKAVHLEGLRVIGDPSEFAQKYYAQGADELIYIDLVASLYGRSNLVEIVRKTAQNVFIPITVGGGVRSIEDVESLLLAGADKVAINTGCVSKPQLIKDVSQKYGSQCMVLSVEAKKQTDGSWEVYTDCARESTGINVIDWVQEAEMLGAGEILLTSIDQEGTAKGYDAELIETVSNIVKVPIIASGGYGKPEDIHKAVAAGADALAFADILHIKNSNFSELRKIALSYDIDIRAL